MVTSLNLQSQTSIEVNVFKNQGEKILHHAYQEMNGDPPSAVPFLVWLLENPDSPLPFSGKIDLYRHDCLHLLLERGFSVEDEAFVVGFTMGNDPACKWFHIALFKLISTMLYPQKFRFNKAHLVIFDIGVFYGRKIRTHNLNKLDFKIYENQSLNYIRQDLGIDIDAIQILWQAQNLLT
ncbi:hypothetical protein NIES22_67270 [Calothrix brevissima NIES-22]|nr:hypothetical protein NIES22_67270 [Calothrix brevissima NIES-22]